MKRMLAFMLLISMVATKVSAEVKSIPAAVTEAFKTKYPKAEQVEWSDNITNYVASFQLDGREYSARFNKKGEWQETMKKLKFDELGSDVKDGFNKSKYTDWEIRGAMEITAKDKEVVYRILVKKNSVQKKYLYYNSKGQLQKDAIAV